MKSLNDYINECYDKSLDYGSRRNNQINDFIDFFGDDVNDVLLEKYMVDETFDYILETLNSHDASKLMNTLKKHFGEYIESFETYKQDPENKNSFIAILKASDTYRRYLKYDEKLKRILDFYGYYVSEFDYKTKNLFIEPKYTSKVDLSEYHNICYHFTDINNVDSILKNGLRCRNQTSREFPDRIYLYATNDKITEENLSDFIKKITNSHNIGVLKIDFNKIKSYSIYRDSAMHEENTFFTYTSIHPKCISFVKELKI